MDVLREHLHVLDGRHRQYAVPEVEDVAGTAADAFEDVVGLAEHPLHGTEQQRRVEVALHRMVVPDPLPLVDEAALSAWLMLLLRERGRRKSLTPAVYPAVSVPRP